MKIFNQKSRKKTREKIKCNTKTLFDEKYRTCLNFCFQSWACDIIINIATSDNVITYVRTWSDSEIRKIFAHWRPNGVSTLYLAAK